MIKGWIFLILNFYIELGKKIMFMIILIVYIFVLMYFDIKKYGKRLYNGVGYID